MRFTLIISTLLFSLFSFSQNLKVLFIGNSYTNNNNLPSIVSNISNDMGTPITVDSYTPGGYTFESHYNDNNTLNKIQQDDWDYVILQAQSQEPSFPDNQVNANTLVYAQLLADEVYANNPCSQVLYYMTWGRENGDPQWGPISTYDGMQNRLRNAYVRFSDSSKASVSPVGVAWKYTRDNNPNLDLYASDGSHPSYAGSYLAACTFYTSIFRSSVSTTNFIGSLTASDADLLQDAADAAVLDSLDIFHLRPKNIRASFNYTLTGNTVEIENTSWHATSSNFDFGDGTIISSPNPIHTYANSPTQYSITLNAENTCETESTSINLGGSSASLSEEGKSQLSVKFENNTLLINSQEPIEGIKLFTLSGNMIFDYELNNSTDSIDVSNLDNGIYLLVHGNSAQRVNIFR